MQSENVVRSMQAHEIVAELLEDVLQEAVNHFLRVFGPDVPPKGYFFSGPHPIADFIAQERPNPNLHDQADIDTYIKHFTSNGYIFVLSNRKSIAIYSQVKPTFGNEAIAAMEQSIYLEQDTPVTFNGKTEAASQVIYSQPLHQTPAQKSAGAAKSKGLTQLATFGGLSGPDGHITNIGTPNEKSIAKGLRTGVMAYVLKYPQGTFAVITPTGYRFSAASINMLERDLGLKPQAKVYWYRDSLNTALRTETTADAAIYRSATPQAGQAPQPGLATPAP